MVCTAGRWRLGFLRLSVRPYRPDTRRRSGCGPALTTRSGGSPRFPTGGGSPPPFYKRLSCLGFWYTWSSETRRQTQAGAYTRASHRPPGDDGTLQRGVRLAGRLRLRRPDGQQVPASAPLLPAAPRRLLAAGADGRARDRQGGGGLQTGQVAAAQFPAARCHCL